MNETDLELDTMYQPQAFSPKTTLSSDLAIADTTIFVDDVSILPDSPNLATITDGDFHETIYYRTKNTTNNSLVDVVRGFEGTAKTFVKSNEIYRAVTAFDQSVLMTNLVKTQDFINTDCVKKTETIIIDSRM